MGDVGVSTDQSPEQDFKLALAYKVRHLLSVTPHLQCEALFSNVLSPVCNNFDPQSNVFDCAALLVYCRGLVAQGKGKAATEHPRHHICKRCDRLLLFGTPHLFVAPLSTPADNLVQYMLLPVSGADCTAKHLHRQGRKRCCCARGCVCCWWPVAGWLKAYGLAASEEKHWCCVRRPLTSYAVLSQRRWCCTRERV